MTAEELAKLFHSTYEKLAPTFGCEMREVSNIGWEEIPEVNKRLMIAVAAQVLAIIRDTVETDLMI